MNGRTSNITMAESLFDGFQFGNWTAEHQQNGIWLILFSHSFHKDEISESREGAGRNNINYK